MNQRTLTYRKANSVDELEALLRLRYETYIECRLCGLIAEANDGIDVDAFDLRAIHFGLFCEDGTKPVGYLRRVQDSLACHASMVNEVVRRHPEHKEAIGKKTSEAFPLLTYLPDRDVIRAQYCNAMAKNRRMAEVGRLVLQKPARSLTTAKFFVEATIAAGMVEGFEESVISLAWSHMSFYERFGFKRMAGTNNHEVVGVMFVCMHWVKENMPEAVRDEIYRMADEYALTGQIRMNGHAPEATTIVAHPQNVEIAPVRKVA